MLCGGGGGCNPKNRRLPEISNLGLVFFSVFLGSNPPMYYSVIDIRRVIDMLCITACGILGIGM